MRDRLTPQVNILICFHPADRRSLHLLETHLLPLSRQRLASIWHADKLQPGEHHDAIFLKHLECAQVVLLLVSADFNAQWDKRLNSLVRMRAAEDPRVVPILVRPCVWTDLPFFGLQPLPASSVPLTIGDVPNEALFAEVGGAVRDIVLQIRSRCPITNPPSTIGDSHLFRTLAQIERERYHLEQVVKRDPLADADLPREPVPEFIHDLVREYRERTARNPPRPLDVAIARFRSVVAQASHRDPADLSFESGLLWAAKFIEQQTRVGSLPIASHEVQQFPGEPLSAITEPAVGQVEIPPSAPVTPKFQLAAEAMKSSAATQVSQSDEAIPNLGDSQSVRAPELDESSVGNFSSPSAHPSCARRAVLMGGAGLFVVDSGTEWRAGRDGALCQILLAEPRVSGTHATLKLEGAQLFVRDENSNNGTFINGESIPAGMWSNVPSGAILRFGPVEFSVRIE